MKRPAIGITPDFADATATSAARYELKTAYADAVGRAGGLPLVVPYTDDAAVVEATLDRLSGVIVTGGAFDIPPEAYGDTRRDGLGVLKEGRTRFETLLLEGAIRRHIPILGVCGGMQLLNVVLGGTLHQDIAREVAHPLTHEQSHDRTQPQHPVEVREGTKLGNLLGRGQLMVNSTHHQAVRKLGEKLVASAVAPDGIVEGIELSGESFVVGVQWHPELMIHTLPIQLSIYKGLVESASEQRR